jgi:hypothetical protein
MVLTDIDHPIIPWSESMERTRLILALRSKEIPLKAKEENGSRTVPFLQDIWTKYAAAYSRAKFSKRLADLRKKVAKDEMTP